MQVQSKRLWCCRCPSLCTENWNNEHQSNFGHLPRIHHISGQTASMLNHLHGEDFVSLRTAGIFLAATSDNVTPCPLLGTWERRVGFPPSLANQTLPPLLAAHPSHPPPPSSSLLGGLAHFYSGEALMPHSSSCGEEVVGTPGRPSPQGRQGRAPSLTFKQLVLWQPAQHFSVILLSFIV